MNSDDDDLYPFSGKLKFELIIFLIKMDDKKYISLDYIIDIQNLRETLEKWLTIRQQYEEDIQLTPE